MYIPINSARLKFRCPQARARRGGGGRSSTSGFGLQAEAFLDWSCVRCTFINAFDEEACQGCGGANLKRDKLLRERRKEVERLGRLKFARECRDRWAWGAFGVGMCAMAKGELLLVQVQHYATFHRQVQ